MPKTYESIQNIFRVELLQFGQTLEQDISLLQVSLDAIIADYSADENLSNIRYHVKQVLEVKKHTEAAAQQFLKDLKRVVPFFKWFFDSNKRYMPHAGYIHTILDEYFRSYELNEDNEQLLLLNDMLGELWGHLFNVEYCTKEIQEYLFRHHKGVISKVQSLKNSLSQPFWSESIQERLKSYPTANTLTNTMTTPSIPTTSNQKFRNQLGTKNFWTQNLLLGREITIFIGEEQHKGQFAIVELDELLASHHEETFAPSVGFPTNAQGYNINDRNYSQDKAAQAQVHEYARDLQPERLITTSRTASGTPIISVDGYVVSGNNRTMSMKLALHRYPENYSHYLQVLSEECSAFGFAMPNFENRLSQKHIFIGKDAWEKAFQHPVLVRLDYDFPAYTTEEMAKYNKGTQKGKRPIDKAMELGAILENNTLCSSRIPDVIGQYDTMSDFYANRKAQKELLDKFQQCNLITEAETPTFYTPESGFTNQGRDFIETTMLSMVLSREALQVSVKDGIRSLRQKVVASIALLMKNKTFALQHQIIPYLNEAFIIASDLQTFLSTSPMPGAEEYKKFRQFLTNQNKLFVTKKYNFHALVINRLLEEGGLYLFKKLLSKYNESVSEELSGGSLFGAAPAPSERLETYFVSQVDAQERLLMQQYIADEDTPSDASEAPQPLPAWLSDLHEKSQQRRLRLEQY